MDFRSRHMAHNMHGCNAAAVGGGSTAATHMSADGGAMARDVDSHSLPDEAYSGLLEADDAEQNSDAAEREKMQHTKDGILDSSPGKCTECQKPLMKNFFPCVLDPSTVSNWRSTAGRHV